MKILKFGGSSVGSPERIRALLEIVFPRIKKGEQIALVFSAYEGVTNSLLAACDQAAKGDQGYAALLKKISERHLAAVLALVSPANSAFATAQVQVWLAELTEILHGIFLLKELTPRAKDYVASFGERFSAYTIASAISDRGVPAEFIDARNIVITDSQFGNAKVNFQETDQRIQALFKKKGPIKVFTGFIGSTTSGETTTLGRGGSDYTAAIVGAAIKAEEIEIWTDVDGMMTADPRKVGKALVIEAVTYEEALELCHFGAKVIYTPTLQPAMDQGIEIRVLNTFNPKAPGTRIAEDRTPSEHPITGVTSIDDVAIVSIQGTGFIGIAGIASRVFGALAASKVNVILISQASSEHNICIAVNPLDAEVANRALIEEFKLELDAGLVDPPKIEKALSVISVVGENMRRFPGISGRLFGALGKNGINVVAIAQGSSELNISVVIPRVDESKALNAVHDAFFLAGKKTLSLFVVGLGLIGGTLLEQVRKNKERLEKDFSLELKVAGICSSKAYLLDPNGLKFESTGTLKEDLAIKGESGNAKNFVQEMRELNLPNAVFVDCSASEEVAGLYSAILDSSISIVTPNKKAQSGPFNAYRSLKQISKKRGVSFLFETSVGAALPVISTLGDLLKSGDRVQKIEAVLSGTLSFIFNTFCAEDATISFSEVVKEAKSLGYTEPDPRDDLNGLDAARKLLILARESGLELELKEVKIDPLLPTELFSVKSVDDFMAKLPKVDASWNERRAEAAKRGNRLCFMAQLVNGKASLGLEEIGSSHPFFRLSGSDNSIAFTTDRYAKQPLVVRGPGAGAEVTAAGVFADIIRLGQ